MTLCVQVHVRFTKINSLLLVGKVIVLTCRYTDFVEEVKGLDQYALRSSFCGKVCRDGIW